MTHCNRSISTREQEGDHAHVATVRVPGGISAARNKCRALRWSASVIAWRCRKGSIQRAMASNDFRRDHRTAHIPLTGTSGRRVVVPLPTP